MVEGRGEGGYQGSCLMERERERGRIVYVKGWVKGRRGSIGL